MSVFTHKENGISFESDQIEVFFGNKIFSTTQPLFEQSSDVHSLKQTHSDIFVSIDHSKSKAPQSEGDALGTTLTKQILLIKTADCLPILIHDEHEGRIAAVHAGWKGVSLRILPKVITKYFSNSKNIALYIGPYIKKQSFEIRSDVLDLILNSIDHSTKNQVVLDKRFDKINLDLLDVLRVQLESSFPSVHFNIQETDIDTKTNLNFNSYRREPYANRRNLSYIKLK